MFYPWLAFGECGTWCEWYDGPHKTKKEALKSAHESFVQYEGGYLKDFRDGKEYQVTLGPKRKLKLVPLHYV